MRIDKSLPVILAVLLMAGCQGERKAVLQVAPDIDLSPRIRVAILPFSDRTGSTDQPSPAETLRQGLLANLRSRCDVTLLELAYVDQVLKRNDWGTPAAAEGADRAALGRALGAEAVVFGAVTEWSSTYLALESTVQVGLQVRMVDTQNGKVLWEGERTEVKHAGLSRGPTGYAAAAFSPLQGLAQSNFYLLAHTVTEELVEDLVRPGQGEGVRILTAAVHMGRSGGAQAGDLLTVVAIGTPQQTAYFSLGEGRGRIPMSEFGSGRYTGRYRIPAGGVDLAAGIRVVLSSRRGARDVYRIASSGSTASQ